MSTIELNLYNILKQDFNLSDERAMAVIAVIEEKQAESIEAAMITFKSQNRDDFHKIDLKIEQTKTDIIKWMFAFWIGSTITTIGSIIAIIKFLKP